ncbi:hypothetical protein DKX38_013759 [Salix brachista]|uniref:MBD domain-containing protein n=1 Tax=Salix brachista TaxID=2182728 RepID=A0A5N5LDG1_9ROSI|nr:hypothetical protein DKX38_013759 [Salix brachista]
MDAKISSQIQDQNNELQVSTTLYQPFKLPNDWVVERRCRSKRGNRRSHNDKYFYIYAFTKYFKCHLISPSPVRSSCLRSGKPGYCFGDRGVESNTRYLTEHGLEHHSPNNDQYPFRASVVSNGKLEKHQKADEAFLVFCNSRLKIQNVPYIFKSRSLFDLPNGWVVERKPCKNIDYAGIIDKHYNELETGKLFRSLRSVEKDLTEGKKHIVTLEALKAEDHFIPFESSGSQKEHVSSKKVETAMLDPSSIPAKIKWVLGGPGGIVWNPFMDDHLVPGFIKQKWSETFVLSIIDRL